jgi:hypothetical protein
MSKVRALYEIIDTLREPGNGGYFVTYTGEIIYPDDIKPQQINIVDIAHHLSNIRRYGGALPFKINYTVAEHCIHIAEYALKYYNKETARVGLMHDAAEAYLGDIIYGLKEHLPEYHRLERKLEITLAEKYSLPILITTPFNGIPLLGGPVLQVVKDLDRRIVLDEARGLMPQHIWMFERINKHEPLGIKITGRMGQEEIKARFLELCEELGVNDD